MSSRSPGNFYAALKFSERLSFETSIKHWQIAANPNISKEEIESILSEIREELSNCASLDEVLETMRTLKEEAKSFDKKDTLASNETEPEAFFQRSSSAPDVKRDLLAIQKLGNSFNESTTTNFATHSPKLTGANSFSPSASFSGKSMLLDSSFRTRGSSMEPIVPGFAVLSASKVSAEKSSAPHKSAGKSDLLDSPFLANVGVGESSPGRGEIRDQLISIAKTSHFAAGDRVVEEGSIGDSMFFVAKGCLVVVVNGTREIPISEGECFGEVALVSVPSTTPRPLVCFALL